MLNETEYTNPENGPKPVAIAALNFKAEVLESKLPVLVEFWTCWSRSCRISDSVLQEVTRDVAGRIKVVKVNADDGLELSLWYEIQSIPTLIFFSRESPASASSGLRARKPF